MRLKGRVALVTGAGSGIGQATALRFAREGACVAALGHTREPLERVALTIERHGGQALAVLAEVQKPDEMQRALSQTIARFERLDIVVANAGINGVWATLDDLSPEEWDHTLAVNLRGTFLTVKYAVPYLRKQGGVVLIVSSVNGTRMFSNTGATAYACSKAAQVAFAKMIALELARDKIRVNVICPGWIDTPIPTEKLPGLEEARPRVEFPEGAVPLTNGGAGTADQVARTLVFLASDDADHVTGTELWVDGGQSLLQA
jgi:NAD(P)-dependent dehydrogenase (short-subunit alcohol dehydrogenase family)